MKQGQAFISRLYGKKWVVYRKQPFDGPGSVLQYLGRYTHRVAISNNRILSVHDSTVTFRWRDYSDGNKQKTMALTVDEFIRRHLLHVLPDRYVRIRHFGLLANRNRKDHIAVCRELLGSGTTVTKGKNTQETWQQLLRRVCGIDVTTCPICKKGKMFMVELLPPCQCNSPPGSSPMSTAVIISLSLPPCENSLLFRLALLLPEIPPRHDLSTAQADRTASPDSLSGLTQSETAAAPPRKYLSAQCKNQKILIESP